MSEQQGPETGHEDQPETGTNLQPETGSARKSETDDASYWRAQADKYEKRAKANATAARELEQLRNQHMTDQERAVADAVAQARQELAAEFGGRLVDAEVKAAAAGRSVNVDALLEGLDRKRFLTEDGDPDAKAIVAWLDKVAPATAATPPLDLGQGQRLPAGAGADMNHLLRQATGRSAPVT